MRYKSHKSVTLDVTEVEYSLITEVCCEMIFYCAILLFIEVVVEYPFTVNVDNIGAILLSENTSLYQHMNHIDALHTFNRDYVENGKVKIKFVPLE